MGLIIKKSDPVKKTDRVSEYGYGRKRKAGVMTRFRVMYEERNIQYVTGHATWDMGPTPLHGLLDFLILDVLEKNHLTPPRQFS